MTPRPRIALVGAGTMGANHARVIAECADAELALIVDSDSTRAEVLAGSFNCAHASDLAAVRGCDAAVLATPTRLHADQAMSLFDLGMPVLIEKPLTPKIADTRALLDEANSRGIPLMCGFVERYNPAAQTVLRMLDEMPVHIVGLRHSPPTPRTTLSVVLDLLIHEIDLVLRYTRSAAPVKVQGVVGGAGAVPGSEIAGCLLTFEPTIATLSATRTGQRKIRSQFIETSSALYEIDLLRQDVTVYRHRSHTYEGLMSYRAETVVDIPFVRHAGEPLALQLEHFLTLIDGRADAAAERDSILPAHEVAAAVEDRA